MSLSSNEINYLIWRYLQEGGLEISAYALQDETKINNLDDKYGERTPIGCLVDLVQKGILYTKIRDLITSKKTNKNKHTKISNDSDNDTEINKIKSESNDNKIEDNNDKDINNNSSNNNNNKDINKKNLVSSITSSLINSKYEKVSILDLQEELINMDFNLYNAVFENSITNKVLREKLDIDTETNENENESKEDKIDETTTTDNNNMDSIDSKQENNTDNTDNSNSNSTIKDEEMKDIDNSEEIEAKLKEEEQKAKEKLEIENDEKEIEELNSLIQSDDTNSANIANGSSNMEIINDENIENIENNDDDDDINNYTTTDLKFTNTSSNDISKPSLKSYYAFDSSISNEWNPSHPDVIAWGQNDNHAKIAALSLNSELKELNLIESKLLNFPLNCKKIISINWANQGHSLITSSENGELRLWDASGSIKFIMALHNSPVLCVKWNKKSSFILSLDIKNKTIIWDANTGKSIQHIDGFNMTSSPLHSSIDSVTSGNNNNNNNINHNINSNSFMSDIFSNDDLLMNKNFMDEQHQLPLPPPPPLAPPAPPVTSEQQKHVSSSAGDADMMALSDSLNDHNSSSSNIVIDKSQNEHSLFGIAPSSSSPLTSNNAQLQQDSSSQDQILSKKQISTSQNDLQINNDEIHKITDSKKISDINDLKLKEDLNNHMNLSQQQQQQITEKQKSNDSIDIINLGIDACWLDDHKFIIPGRSGSLLAFNLGESLPIGCLKGHEGIITKILYNEELKLLVSSSTDNTIRIWQGDNPNSCQILIGHSQSIVYIKWLKLTNDYPVLLSCSIDGTIRLWDVSSGDLISLTIANSGSPIFEASVSPDLKKLVTGDSNNLIKVWDIDSKMVLNKFFKIYKKNKNKNSNNSNNTTTVNNNNFSKLLNLRLNLINYFELPEIENNSNNNKISCISWSKDSLKFSVSFSNSKSHIIKLDE